MSSTIVYGVDSDGSNRVEIHVDTLEHDYTYSNGLISTDTVTLANGAEYRKTYTWSNGNLTNETPYIRVAV